MLAGLTMEMIQQTTSEPWLIPERRAGYACLELKSFALDVSAGEKGRQGKITEVVNGQRHKTAFGGEGG